MFLTSESHMSLQICIFLRYRSDFSLTCANFEIKKKIKHDCVCGCLFNSCCINLYYEWNSLLKNSFSFFFKNIKNRSDFSVIKNLFFFNYHKTNLIFYKPKKPFLFLKFLKIDLIFFKSKDFVLCNKQNKSEFLSPKTIFSTYYNTDLALLRNQNQFFLLLKQIRIFLKQRREWIHK